MHWRGNQTLTRTRYPAGNAQPRTLLVTDCDVRRHDKRAMDTQPGVSRGAVTLRAASLRRGPAAPVCAVVTSDADDIRHLLRTLGARVGVLVPLSGRAGGSEADDGGDHLAADDLKRRDLPDVHHRADRRLEA